MELFSYFRSSAAYRVRIALNFKSIPHTIRTINLLKGEEGGADYLRINPQGLVPSLRLDDGRLLSQSQSIIEYLDLQFPSPELLDSDPFDAARQRALAAAIACDIHPLNNSRVLKYLSGNLEISEEDKNTWYSHWIVEGFKFIEERIQAAPYACSNRVSLVDIFLVPQVYNAHRFSVPMDQFPKISSVYESCNLLEFFKAAKPENQSDAV